MVVNQLVEDNLRHMLRDLFKVDSTGGRRDRLARAHGYTDGYMMALVDIGIATQDELLEIVLDERRRVEAMHVAHGVLAKEVNPSTTRFGDPS